jgi:hypothetical protein
MHLALVRIALSLPSGTLKEKRTILRSTIARLRERYNAAVVEDGPLDDPGAGSIVAACLSNDVRHAQSQAQAIADAVTGWRLDVVVDDIAIEVIDL